MLSMPEIIGLIIIILAHLSLVIYVYSDATRRHFNTAGWTALVAILPVLGVAAYAYIAASSKEGERF